MLLSPPSVCATKFTWTGRVGVVDISEFEQTTQLGQVYDDACDLGFTVVSPRTSRRIVFACSGTILDSSGETVAIKFTSVTPGFKEQFEIHLLND